MTQDNDNEPPVQFHPDFGDPGLMLDMLDWLEGAVVARGALFLGGGIGMGEAEIEISLEGHKFIICIRPIMQEAS